MKTIIIQTYPELKWWATFTECCRQKGWVHQTLANQGKVPKVGTPTTINGCILHRISPSDAR